MAVISKILIAATATVLVFSPANAEDASPTPEPQASNQVSSTQITRQADPIARAAAFYGTYQKDVGELQSRGLHSVSDVDNALTLSLIHI